MSYKLAVKIAGTCLSDAGGLPDFITFSRGHKCVRNMQQSDSLTSSLASAQCRTGLQSA